MTPVFDELLAVAVERHGLVTTADARDLGIDPAQLRLLAQRGRLEHIHRGVYRVMAMPVDELLPYAEAAAWAAPHGAVSHESALAMRDLGDFNPSRIDVAFPLRRQVRGKVPPNLRVHTAELAAAELDYYEGVQTVTVLAALRLVIADGSDPYIVRRAVADAYKAGHISVREADRLRHALVRSAQTGTAS